MAPDLGPGLIREDRRRSEAGVSECGSGSATRTEDGSVDAKMEEGGSAMSRESAAEGHDEQVWLDAIKGDEDAMSVGGSAAAASKKNQEVDQHDARYGLLATSGGRFVVMRDGKAVLHNPSTRRSFAIHDDSSDKARCISLHPSGDLVAIGGEQCVRIWSRRGGAVVKELGLGLVGRGVGALDFSASGRWLICEVEKEFSKLLLWDWAQGSLLCMKTAHRQSGWLRCLKFCPEDETSFVSAGRQHLSRWRVQHASRSAGAQRVGDTEVVLASRRAIFCGGGVPEMVSCVAFGRGGVLFAGTRCGKLLVCCDNLVLRTVPAHVGGVTALLATAAGQLITAGTDQVVREWKAFEIREEVTEMEVCDEVVALAAMEDGMVLVLGQRSGEMPIALRLGSQASACRR